LCKISVGIQREREPSVAGRVAVDAAVAPGRVAIAAAAWDRISEETEASGTESPGVREGGEDSFSTIKGAEAEHTLGVSRPGQEEQLGFEQGRPAARLFRKQAGASAAGAAGFWRITFGFCGSHRFLYLHDCGGHFAGKMEFWLGQRLHLFECCGRALVHEAPGPWGVMSMNASFP